MVALSKKKKKKKSKYLRTLIHGVMENDVMFLRDQIQCSSTSQKHAMHKGFSSATQSCPTRCNPMNCSMPGLPVYHKLPEFTQTHVHGVGDAIQPSHPLSSPSPPAPNSSQHQGLFQRVNSSHEVAKVLEFQLQHQSFQWHIVIIL